MKYLTAEVMSVFLASSFTCWEWYIV